MDILKRNPAVFLLLFVYLWIIPHCLSYQNAWIEPEQFRIKYFILKEGPELNIKDLKEGLSWQLFEYRSRCTRPLSSYFEIIDTKLRTWLWHYILPHPALSLSWVFSLILSPLFLYRLLRNINIGTNTAMAMTAFYLATPGVLSFETMLFRPAKPMTNFSIILCLFLASGLKKEFLDKQRAVPVMKFLAFWTIAACSFYWDETALLIFPAVLFIFPSIFKRRSFLFSWLLLIPLTIAAYLWILPFLSQWAGYGWPDLFKYLKNDFPHSVYQTETIHHSFSYLLINSRNLILETMGIYPFSNTSPAMIIIFMVLAVISWASVLLYIAKIKINFDLQIIFLAFLLFFFNSLMSTTETVWGPYYYGSFWSVFFVLFLSGLIEKTNMPKMIFTACFFCIIVSAANDFIGTNTIYKKYHWYPYSPHTIQDYFKGTRTFFDQRDTPVFSGNDIKSAVERYWSMVRKKENIEYISLPRELGWLPIELEPSKTYNRYTPGALFKSDFQKEFPDGPEICDWLVQQGYLVIYPPANYFIKEDLGTTITEGLKKKYPDRWGKILAFLRKAQSMKPYYYVYTVPGLVEASFNQAVIYYRSKEYSKAWGIVHKIEALGVPVNPVFIKALQQASGTEAVDHE